MYVRFTTHNGERRSICVMDDGQVVGINDYLDLSFVAMIKDLYRYVARYTKYNKSVRNKEEHKQ